MKKVVIYIISVTMIILYVVTLSLTFKLNVTPEYRLFFIDNKIKDIIPDGELNVSLNEQIETFGTEKIYYFTDGWYDTEAEYTWTQGNKATIYFFTKEKNKEKDIKFKFYALSALKDRNITIYFNDKKVGKVKVLKNIGNEYEVKIPKDMVKENTFYDNIVMEFDENVNRMADETTSEDNRKLGIAVKWFEIEQ